MQGHRRADKNGLIPKKGNFGTAHHDQRCNVRRASQRLMIERTGAAGAAGLLPIGGFAGGIVTSSCFSFCSAASGPSGDLLGDGSRGNTITSPMARSSL